jgi:hypothetical protein
MLLEAGHGATQGLYLLFRRRPDGFGVVIVEWGARILREECERGICVPPEEDGRHGE